MRQIWITKAGGPERLQVQEVPDPIAGNGEVRIRSAASGINFADILGRMGVYPDAPPIPYVPGYEIAGTIDEIGPGVPDSYRVGDEVVAFTRFGGYSDVLCVPYQHVLKRPEGMGAEEAAALPVNYGTAYMMLVVMGSLRFGDRVLIHSAGGGVGLAALDICKILGAETFGTASAFKHEFLLERGLNHPINYRENDYEAVVQELTKGEGVQLILDPLGGINWRKNYRLLAPTGRLVFFGASSFAPGKRRSLLAILRGMLSLPRYTPLKLMDENKAVMGANIGHLWDRIDLVTGWLEQLLSWYEKGHIQPHIDKRFPFEEAAEAHNYIQDRKNIGKVLLIP